MPVFPPLDAIKVHHRAKNIIFKLIPRRGLQITVPPSTRTTEIERAIVEKKAWIKKGWGQICKQTPLLKIDLALPDEISLQAIDKSYTIFYSDHFKKNTRGHIEYKENQIFYYGPTVNTQVVIKNLKQSLKKIAYIEFKSILDTLSQRMSVTYSHLSIREQKSLWGSCTSQKKISLNYKILFLPKELAWYILIHELAHTRFLNHSKNFWDFVAIFDEEYIKHDKALKSAETFMPLWIQ